MPGPIQIACERMVEPKTAENEYHGLQPSKTEILLAGWTENNAKLPTFDSRVNHNVEVVARNDGRATFTSTEPKSYE